MERTAAAIAAQLQGKLGAGVDPDEKLGLMVLKAWNMGKSDIFVPLWEGARKMIFRAEARGGIVLTDDASLCEKDRYILVDNVEDSILNLAIIKRDKFDGELIGITGSAGKSTTKTMLNHVLEDTQSVYMSQSNQNLSTYTQATLANLPMPLDYAIFEIAMFDENTVRESARVATPTISVVTSIGMNHAGNVGGLEGVILAKTEIFYYMTGRGLVILPSMDKHCPQLRARAEGSLDVKKIITVGLNEDDYTQLLDYELGPTSSKVKIRVDREEIEYSISQPGYHFILDSLFVAATLGQLDLDLGLMKRMESYDTPGSSINRFRVDFPVGERSIELFDDAIISSPHQVLALLDILKMRKDAKRKILLFGDMTALGDEAQQLHDELAPHIDATGFDLVVTAGPHSAEMAKKLKTPNKVYPSSLAASNDIVDLIEDGDLWAIKASGPTHMKTVTKKIYAAGKRKSAGHWVIGDYLSEA